jgi:hypothetical protein
MKSILYIQSLNQNCINALKLNILHDVHIVDINELVKKPTWLTGVPTLLMIDNKTLYTGTECLLYLKNKV